MLRKLFKATSRQILVTFLAAVITACGGGGDDDPTGVVVTTEFAQPKVYQNAYLQINYPNNWLLNVDDDELSAQVYAPQANQYGGNDNCAITSGYYPGTVLIDAVDDVLSLMDNEPQAQTSFLVVNNQQTARISGFLSFVNITIPATVQIMHENDIEFTHIVICAGLIGEKVNIQNFIFNSMKLI